MAPSASKAKAAAAAIFSLIDKVSPIDFSSQEGVKKDKDQVKGNIEFKNVEFHYPTRPEVSVLRKFRLTASAGKVTALVGASGCGKSSCVGLIERWYDPVNGNVLLDDTDLREYNVKWLREQISLVGQEPVLFSGTIAENIAYGKEDATQEEIEEAAKAANAHKFISGFPLGYKTQVGEKGTQLSGGQKQRIAIARAIIKNPTVLLLDEATSALDTESEKVVQQALDSVMKGRTTIVIAHRLSTIRNADQIAVIQNGKVVELGNHEELMQLEGFYYNLVIRQT
jgi:ATP-binding cassette subfamily B (MDR/TAP) protein 1